MGSHFFCDICFVILNHIINKFAGCSLANAKAITSYQQHKILLLAKFYDKLFSTIPNFFFSFARFCLARGNLIFSHEIFSLAFSTWIHFIYWSCHQRIDIGKKNECAEYVQMRNNATQSVLYVRWNVGDAKWEMEYSFYIYVSCMHQPLIWFAHMRINRWSSERLR